MALALEYRVCLTPDPVSSSVTSPFRIPTCFVPERTPTPPLLLGHPLQSGPAASPASASQSSHLLKNHLLWGFPTPQLLPPGLCMCWSFYQGWSFPKPFACITPPYPQLRSLFPPVTSSRTVWASPPQSPPDHTCCLLVGLEALCWDQGDHITVLNSTWQLGRLTGAVCNTKNQSFLISYHFLASIKTCENFP